MAHSPLDVWPGGSGANARVAPPERLRSVSSDGRVDQRGGEHDQHDEDDQEVDHHAVLNLRLADLLARAAILSNSLPKGQAKGPIVTAARLI